ncbi:MAG: LysM peptidoglycan-binding domain-containing protein [Victivallaceae bacterium]|nr:LysM peptidoglycan-binding domain-containing protein [Victivallaceae bacterium]
MTRQTVVLYGFGGALMLALCGCGPELAQVNYGTEEAEWTRGIQHSYRGYRPPRTAPPAIEDNVSPRLIESEENKALETAGEVEIPDAVDDSVSETAGDAANAEAAEAVPAPEADPSAAPAADNAAVPADNLEFTVYTVKAGDTLSKIAKEQYGDARKYDVIIKANGITDPGKVRIGTKLQIPKL